MKLNLFQVVGLATGGLLLYAGINNVNPVDVIKSVLNNQPLPTPSGLEASGRYGTADANERNAPTVSPYDPPRAEMNIKSEGGPTKGMPVSKILSV